MDASVINHHFIILQIASFSLYCVRYRHQKLALRMPLYTVSILGSIKLNSHLESAIRIAYSLPKLAWGYFYTYIEGSREGIRGHYKYSLKIYFSQYFNLHF